MTELKVSRERVNQAAEQIKGSGEKPTIARVRDSLGGGSPNAIHLFLKEWKDGQAAEKTEVEPVPEHVQRSLMDEFERRASAARAKAEAEAIESAETAYDLAHVGVKIEAEAAELREQNARLLSERDNALIKASERQAQIDKLTAQCEAEQTVASDAKRETAKAGAMLELQQSQIEKLEANLATVQTKLDEEREKTATAVREAAVSAGKCAAETRRADDAVELGIKTGVRDLDAINELKKELAEVRKDAKEAEKLKDKAHNDALRFKIQFNEANDKNRDLATQVQSLKDALTEAKSDLPPITQGANPC